MSQIQTPKRALARGSETYRGETSRSSTLPYSVGLRLFRRECRGGITYYSIIVLYRCSVSMSSAFISTVFIPILNTEYALLLIQKHYTKTKLWVEYIRTFCPKVPRGSGQLKMKRNFKRISCLKIVMGNVVPKMFQHGCASCSMQDAQCNENHLGIFSKFQRSA